MIDAEKIQNLEKRLAVLEKSKRQRRWLWLAAAIILPATLYAATTIPNTFSDGEVLSAEKLNANFAALAASDSTPAGTVVAYAGTTAPTGWLLCNGATVSRTTYAALFAATGSSFGAGDGSSTFHLPDFRGRFLRGVDGTAAVDPDKATRTAMNVGGATGNSVGSIQGEEFKSHTHNTYFGGTNPTGGGGGIVFHDSFPTNNPRVGSATGGNETRPVNAYVNWIIKY